MYFRRLNLIGVEELGTQPPEEPNAGALQRPQKRLRQARGRKTSSSGAPPQGARAPVQEKSPHPGARTS